MSYNKASLVLIPSGYKEGQAFSQKPVNGDGDFGVASSATTRVNADGLIEKETQNLLLQSNTFSSANWVGKNATLTGGQIGYDGSSNAWFAENATVGQIMGQNIISSGVQTISIYAKGSVNSGIRIFVFGDNNVDFWINLNTGLPDGAVSSKVLAYEIKDEGSGWYRCSFAFIQTTSSVYFYATDNNRAVSSTADVYIQDAQLEQGLVARDYIETTTSAVYSGMTDNVPQLDYFGNSCPAYLFEPQKTNIVINSEYPTGPPQRVTLEPALSPEGKNNALKVSETSDTGQHYVSYKASVVNGTTYVISFFIKQGTYETIVFYTQSAKINLNISYNFTTNSVNTGGADAIANSAMVEDYGNGWKRLSARATAHADGEMDLYCTVKDLTGYAGDPANHTYYYGFQIEEGYYLTSLIPTYGTARTRILNYFNDSVSALYDISNDFSFVIHWRDTKPATTSQNLFSVSTDSPNSFYIYLNASRVNIYINNGGGYVFGSGANGSWTGPTTKIAITWNNRTKELKYFINGSLFDSGIFPDHNYGTTTGVTPLFAGSNGKSSLEKFLFYKEALSDQECIDITT